MEMKEYYKTKNINDWSKEGLSYLRELHFLKKHSNERGPDQQSEHTLNLSVLNSPAVQIVKLTTVRLKTRTINYGSINSSKTDSNWSHIR